MVITVYGFFSVISVTKSKLCDFLCRALPASVLVLFDCNRVIMIIVPMITYWQFSCSVFCLPNYYNISLSGYKIELVYFVLWYIWLSKHTAIWYYILIVKILYFVFCLQRTQCRHSVRCKQKQSIVFCRIVVVKVDSSSLIVASSIVVVWHQTCSNIFHG